MSFRWKVFVQRVRWVDRLVRQCSIFSSVLQDNLGTSRVCLRYSKISYLFRSYDTSPRTGRNSVTSYTFPLMITQHDLQSARRQQYRNLGITSQYFWLLCLETSSRVWGIVSWSEVSGKGLLDVGHPLVLYYLEHGHARERGNGGPTTTLQTTFEATTTFN